MLTRMLIVEPSPLIRSRLATLACEHPHIHVIALAENAMRTEELLSACTPDSALVDIDLPEGDGLSVLKRIREISPGCVVGVLTKHAFPELNRRCAELGARFLFRSPHDAEEMFESLKARTGPASG